MDYDDAPPGQGRVARSRGHNAPPGRVLDYKSQAGQSYQEQLEQLEADAYSAVLRAFGAQSEAITWAKERLISDLRTELNIDDILHRQLLDRVHSDSSIQKICRWKKAQEAGGAFHPPSPPVLEPVPGPSGPQSRKKQKTTGPLSTPIPVPPAKPEPVATSSRLSPPPKRGSLKGKGRKGRGGRVMPTGTGQMSDEAVDEAVHPWIGKRIKTRWTEEDGSFQFYESVISDYRPETGEHGLVYDMGTPLESWEWVDLNKMPKQDIVWLPGPAVKLVPRAPGGAGAGRGNGRNSVKRLSNPRAVVSPPAVRGQRQGKGQATKIRTAGNVKGAQGFGGPTSTDDVPNGSSDISGPVPDSLLPLEQIVKVDSIEKEENLQRLEEAKKLAKEREEALRRALEEVGSDSSGDDDDDDDDDDDGDDEPSVREREGDGPRRVNSDNRRELSQGDYDDDSQGKPEEYERGSNLQGDGHGGGDDIEDDDE